MIKFGSPFSLIKETDNTSTVSQTAIDEYVIFLLSRSKFSH